MFLLLVNLQLSINSKIVLVNQLQESFTAAFGLYYRKNRGKKLHR